MIAKKLLDLNQKSKVGLAHANKSNLPIAYHVAHAIRGRVRFHVPLLGKDSKYAEKLKALVESDARVTQVRINPIAASIAINYKSDTISDQDMREHLINLIQTAPNVTLPKRLRAASVATAVFDAIVNLIDSARNINKVRKGVTEKQLKNDFWERALGSIQSTIKGLKSAVMFFFPQPQSQTPSALMSSGN
ncbi:MAG: hypothetical protein IGS39_22150 [Calothrix sp. C42_A2020_038]|nr:hypothetical protein [Calothrix sp. C42_A2020_038]